MRMSDEQWDNVLDINLKGSFTSTRSVIKHMMKKRFGRIINITSIVGLTGNAGQANYAASKAGLIGMTKSIAKEVASRGITANCIAPGWIETSMTDELSDDVKNKFLSLILFYNCHFFCIIYRWFGHYKPQRALVLWAN